jgi:DNA-binding NarL/FixJ family response regulator
MPPKPTAGLPDPASPLAPLVWSDAEWRAMADRLKLSGRELQIVRGILDGRKEPCLARELGISTHTVHSYLVRLYLKLGVNSRMELAMRIMAEHRHSQ